MGDGFRYRAFISYSHADEKWARWLHRTLETYRVPKRLVGTTTPFGTVPERLAPVFRDREELATSTDLGATLTRALEQSAIQLVICSPKAVKSRWVNEEILAFKRFGREGRIFALIVDGEPWAIDLPGREAEECFPEALRLRMGADGQLTATRSEPIAADVRPGKDGKSSASLKLIAGMLGLGLDELRRREAQRRQRRLFALAAASVTGMVITSGLAAAAWIARNEAERERARAEAETRTAQETTRFLVDLFKVSDPSEALGNQITAREILDKGASRIETELAGQPAIQATLMDTMGQVYTSLGLYKSAVPLLRQALATRQGLPGESGDGVATSLQNLGEALTRTADYDEAERSLRAALELRRSAGDASRADPELAATLTALADLMLFRGRYADGQPLIEEALRIRRAVHGELHPDVAESVGDLGVNLAQQGRFADAEKYLREALAMQRRLRKGPHPDLAEALNNVGWALNSLNRPAEAEPFYREALAMNRRLLGEAHPEIASGLNNLAVLLEKKGDLDGAEAAHREAIAMNRKLFGDAHPQVAQGLNNLAFLEYRRGRQASAIALLREALEMRRRGLGATHPDVAGSAASLGYWLIWTGDYAESRRLIDESLAIRREALGPEHPLVASTLNVQANLELATGQYAAALRTARAARRILEAKLPPSHWQLAMAVNAEGAALAGLRDFDSAGDLLMQSIDRLASAPLPGVADRGRRWLRELYVDARRESPPATPGRSAARTVTD